jgi:cellulose synthase/poly-beta-1,6-N-acetylglucosamine synthase-like glycosyltransferase
MKILFWVSLAIVVYVYFGYPLVLAAGVRRSRSLRQDDGYLPTVSLVIAAHNEAKVLPEKLANSLALDYPRQRLEIVVASDGSTDATNAIARAYADRGVVLHALPCRGGKTRALSLVVPRTHGDILVLSDANTMYRPDAIRKLVRHFIDPRVGAVSGDVRLVNAADSHAYSEGVYYRYERWLQGLESRLGAMIGVDGAMYAIRRECFQPPSPDIILDDFVISMTVARLGYRVLYDPEAWASEQGTLSSGEEYRRKVRIVAGGIQALKRREGLPRWRQPLLLFCYVSHKLLRWLLPCFLVLVFLTSVALAHVPLYRYVLLGQIVFAMLAVGYGVGILGLRRHRWWGIPYYFCLVNGAALLGLWKGVWGTQTVTWQRTAR